MKSFVFVQMLAFLVLSCTEGSHSRMEGLSSNGMDTETATFAGGCFWCIEAPFENIDGVTSVVSGYTGGDKPDPTYIEVSSGSTDHFEAVQIEFNPKIVSYTELVDLFWKQFDPTDEGGSFYDRGNQYKSAIFYHSREQKKVAENSRNELNNSGLFDKPVVTEILKFKSFYPAEEYHQDYYKKKPVKYENYKEASGRKDFILSVWGNWNADDFEKPTPEELKEQLTDIQFQVTQEDGTEPAFDNPYWDNKKEGIYVDIVSGEPLFSSADKFRSGTGWPSFTKPIDVRFVNKVKDNSFGMTRIEVRSKFADSHIGHVFYDGPEPTRLRYCMNSAALRFIPREKMEEEGYENYLWVLE